MNRESALKATCPKRRSVLGMSPEGSFENLAGRQFIDDGAKTLELASSHLIFLEKPVELASAILSFCQLQQDFDCPIVPCTSTIGRSFSPLK
jgi:hypothetical protein